MTRRTLWGFVAGFTAGAGLTLGLATHSLRGLDARLCRLELRHADRLREIERRDAVDRWRAKYGRWVQLIENPPQDPPPAGALPPEMAGPGIEP